MADDLTDLFGAATLPGLTSMSDIVSPAEEAALIVQIDRTSLSPFRFQGWLGKRLTTSYGLDYDFAAGRLDPADPIPGWLNPVRERAAQLAGLDRDELTQALLIRYDPGAGINWHRDRSVYEHVVGISLGAPATMRFRRRVSNGFQRASVVLAPRSIYHLSSEARHDWEHSIAAMSDTRWSITFRSLSASGQKALGQVVTQDRDHQCQVKVLPLTGQSA